MNNLQKILIILAGIIIISVIVIEGAILLSDQPSNESADNNDQTTLVNNTIIAATVNGVDITYNQVVAYQQSIAQQGQNISEKQALEELIDQEVLIEAAQQEQYIPSEQEAEQELIALLAEQNVTLDAYKQQLQSQGVSYEHLMQKYILQLTIDNYLDEVLYKNLTNISQEEAYNYYQNYSNQSQGEVPSFEEMEEQIISYLQEQKNQEAFNAIIKDLRNNAEIVYH